MQSAIFLVRESHPNHAPQSQQHQHQYQGGDPCYKGSYRGFSLLMLAGIVTEGEATKSQSAEEPSGRGHNQDSLAAHKGKRCQAKRSPFKVRSVSSLRE